MKKRSFSLLIGLIVIIILLLGLPRHRTADTTMTYPEIGRLMNVEGRSILFPFLQEIRLGTWTSMWETGEIGEVLDYSFGRLVFRSMYYPNGQIKLRTQYRKGIPYGTWTNYHQDGSIEFQKDHDDSGLPNYKIFYDENGDIVFHVIDGKVVVDKMKILNKNEETKPEDPANCDQ